MQTLRIASTTALLGALMVASAGSMAHAQARHWYRGNTHAHTSNSDGDSPPDSVARWYRDNGYTFLFITDHERITDPQFLNARYGAPGKFLLIAGQEVTQRVIDSTHTETRRQAHVNSLGARTVVLPLGANGLASGITMRAGYARNIAAIREAGGIAQVNHPNYRWSVRLDDLVALPDSTLIEIANAHSGVNNLGGTDERGRAAPSTEALWDSLLTRGTLLFAVADDDSHSFTLEHADAHDLTRPGRGWIVVRADTLTPAAILSGIRRGDFYASTGVMLRDLAMDGETMRLVMDPGPDDRRFVTEFIGRGGRALATSYGARATYRVRGDEGYVRARITDSNGNRAWTQPVVLRR